MSHRTHPVTLSLSVALIVNQALFGSFIITRAVELPPEEPSLENTLALCTDEIDNDFDEDTDMKDSDCAVFLPKLTVVKTVINDGGGTKTVADFPLLITEDAATPEIIHATSGVPQTVDPGSYIVSETSDPGYTASAWGGNCDPTGHVTLALGENKTCTITNNDNGTTGGGSSGGGGGGGGAVFPTNPTKPTTPSTPNNNPGGGSQEPANPPASPNPPANPTPENGEVLGATTNDIIPCTPYLNSYIKLGNQNNPEEVKKLQRFLNSYLGLTLEVNGEYNLDTYNAVKKFQKKEFGEVLKPWGIRRATGYVYKTTKRRINMIMCSDLKLPMPQLP